MKKIANRRAFTIVELVIVIAVIAILSAVLIPTFGNMIAKTKESKLTLEAKNAYIQYLVDHAVDEEDTEFTIFVSNGKFVTMQNGAPKGIFESGESALEGLFGEDAEKYVVPDAETEGLFICRLLDTENDPESFDELKLLIVGDSDVASYMTYVGEIAAQAGVKSLYISYHTVTENSINIDPEEFDYVIFQHGGKIDGQADTYFTKLCETIEYVKTNVPSVKPIWLLDDAVQPVSSEGITLAIPSYIAAQNSWTSVLQQNLSDKYKAYLTSLTVVKAITGMTVDSDVFAPDDISEIEKLIAVESVNNAINDPTTVTNSKYALSDDYDIITP